MRLQFLVAKLRGKKHELPIHFGFNTQADFCEELKVPIEEYDSRVAGPEMRLNDIRILTWHALRNGHRRSAYKDTPFDITREDIGDMIDDNPGLITEVFKLLVNAQPAPAPTDEKADAGNAGEG